MKCVQSLKTIFSNGDRAVCTGYIHALAPRLMDYLHTRDAKQISTDMELTLTLETISALHALVLLTEPKHSKYCLFIRMILCAMRFIRVDPL